MDDDLVSVPDDGEPAPEPPKAEPEVAKNGVSKRPGGVTGKGFLPGHGLIPSTRQKSLASLVRFRTENGRQLVALMSRILRGGKFKLTVVTADGVPVEVARRPSVRDRMDAAAWLADRGWGKVKDVLKLEGDEGRRPVNIVFLGGPRQDPLAEPGDPPRRALPRPPVIAEEVEFELTDVELPPKERPGA